MTFQSITNSFDRFVIKLTFIYLVFRDVTSFISRSFIEQAPIAAQTWYQVPGIQGRQNVVSHLRNPGWHPMVGSYKVLEEHPWGSTINSLCWSAVHLISECLYLDDSWPGPVTNLSPKWTEKCTSFYSWEHFSTCWCLLIYWQICLLVHFSLRCKSILLKFSRRCSYFLTKRRKSWMWADGGRWFFSAPVTDSFSICYSNYWLLQLCPCHGEGCCCLNHRLVIILLGNLY